MKLAEALKEVVAELSAMDAAQFRAELDKYEPGGIADLLDRVFVQERDALRAQLAEARAEAESMQRERDAARAECERLERERDEAEERADQYRSAPELLDRLENELLVLARTEAAAYREALEKIADPRILDHKEPDAYTQLGCLMHIAQSALDRIKRNGA